MRKTSVPGRAWSAYTASPCGTLKFLLVQVCLRMMCLAPLLCLSDRNLAPGAVLSPVMWILILLPARMNAAAAMRDALAGGPLCSARLVETAGYGEKLLMGLKRLGFLMLWGAPLIFLAVRGWSLYTGETDVFSVLRMIRGDLGGGDQLRGILVLLGLIAGSLLLLAAGCAFHSGARHAWAQGDPRLVNGRHGMTMLFWLMSLLCLLPLAAAVAVTVVRYLPAVTDLTGLLTKKVQLPRTDETVWILAAGAALTLPLLPLRALIPAAWAAKLKEKA